MAPMVPRGSSEFFMALRPGPGPGGASPVISKDNALLSCGASSSPFSSSFFNSSFFLGKVL
eukprot:CAMPEP_0174965122 /NCGR_PEP_ID=MMETSP0004_2-20121128/6264_1 /TAXON_ID=420556 /ORGANISM="Ochromonas sp., Strain CCMP1393" /LENGTH=60 /DNA_ID=CAMNT_0016213931 /DNA_START=433 /DNA_END=615 /DNA_ORIENTATION=-